MPAEATTLPQTADQSHKSTFFRQSGWMMITSVGGGVLMFVVQVIAVGFLKKEEYSAFVALIQLTNWMMIPSLGLQMVFAQQAAAAVTEKQQRQLVRTMKLVLLWTFCIWLLMAVITFADLDRWIAVLQLKNSASLILTLLVGFTMLWQPVFQGLLQGRQNFFWLGWMFIFNGAGRLIIGAVIVIALHGQASGLMAAVLIGLVAAVGAGAWQNFDLWRQAGEAFKKSEWLGRVIRLTLGFGVPTFIFSADALVVQDYLGKGGGAADYMFGSTLCRAIVLFTTPLAAVMFPKLVRSRASASKSGLMLPTLLFTGALSVSAVIGLWLVCPIIFHLLHKDSAGIILPLIPLFAAGMVPLGMGNVLLYNLMAHSRFRIVPAVVILAVCYWIALQHFHDTFKMVIQTFDIFTVIYLIICVLFNWVIDGEKNTAA
jgi:O-antigen/teichoic acid export membrane protein